MPRLRDSFSVLVFFATAFACSDGVAEDRLANSIATKFRIDLIYPVVRSSSLPLLGALISPQARHSGPGGTYWQIQDRFVCGSGKSVDPDKNRLVSLELEDYPPSQQTFALLFGERKFDLKFVSSVRFRISNPSIETLPSDSIYENVQKIKRMCAKFISDSKHLMAVNTVVTGELSVDVLFRSDATTEQIAGFSVMLENVLANTNSYAVRVGDKGLTISSGKPVLLGIKTEPVGDAL